MMRLVIAVATVVSTAATLLSDTGCHCALVKGTITTPAATGAVGCSTKLDWNGNQTRWCLTDQTAGACGLFQTGFGYVDSCAAAGIVAEAAVAGPIYTGQNLTINWTTTNFLPDELLRLTFNGRILATNVSSVAGAGAGAVTVRVPTAGTNQSVVISSLSSPAVSANTTERITVLQSALTATNATYNGTSIAGTTQVVDDRTVIIAWVGVGDAAAGNATVTVKSNGGFGGTRIVGTPVWTVGTSVNYVLPRTFTPGGGGGTTYIAAISLQSTTGTVYTLNTASFSLVAAPSQTPTPSGTPTPSKTGITLSNTPTNTPTPTQTPTASLSVGATSSNTPSVTPTRSTTSSLTATPSESASATLSQTPSQTPAASVDYVGIAAAAAATSAKNTGALIGGIIGGVAGLVVIIVGAVRIYQRYELRQRRERKLRTARERGIDSTIADVYGVNPSLYYASRQAQPQRQVPRPPQQRPQDRVRR